MLSDQLPPPAGPYSPVARVGGIVMSAGQGGADSRGAMSTDIVIQIDRCLRNVVAAIVAGGATEDEIVKVTVYLTSVDHFATMNSVYATVFSAPFPARTTVYVTLPAGMVIEADAIAITQESHE